MFDLGLSELMLVGVVALIVLGPEKLPRVARMAGSVFGRAQRYVHQLRSEINREFAIDDLHQLREEVHGTVSEIENTFSRDTFFSGGTNEQEAPTPSEELAAAKAKSFRHRKTGIRTASGMRAGKGRLMRKQLTSAAARAQQRSSSFWREEK